METARALPSRPAHRNPLPGDTEAPEQLAVAVMTDEPSLIEPPDHTHHASDTEEGHRPLPSLDELKAKAETLNAGIQAHLDHLKDRHRRTGE